MPPLYHLLDPLWTRVPMPVTGRVEQVRVGPLTALRMGRALGGRVWMWVYCYVVGDTLVDCGLAPLGDRVARDARAFGIRRAVVTHHHEDHSGNAARLAAEGVEVLAAPDTAALMAAPAPVPFYEHLFWGKAPPARPGLLGSRVAIGERDARVVPAPGHCDDQIALHVPSEGWLFSGDVFLHERVKLFRRDEDFTKTVATLERLCALDFDVLFCAHRPRVEGGRAALRAKLDWLREIEGRVRDLHARGRSPRAIARALKIPANPMTWLTLGDASTLNMVRSILDGPRPRPG